MNEEFATQNEAEILHTAAIVGTPELAREIEQIGLCDPEDSLALAKGIRPFLLREGPECLDDLEHTLTRMRIGLLRELLRRKTERLRRMLEEEGRL